MNKFFKAFLVLTVLPLLMLLSGCNSEGAFSGSETSPPPPKEIVLERIDLAPSSPTTFGVSQLTLPAGGKQSFEAVGHFSDGSSRILTDLSVNNWRTSNQDMVYFDAPGTLICGNIPGLVTVYVTQDGITSNEVIVNVTDTVITAIQVTPSPMSVAKGQMQQLSAIATYSDDTSLDVSNSVTWAPVDTT
ncbi:hypothetical protein PRZ62_21915, partial [Shewanella algae]|nr:hypothetical protein [Shewanella algae]